MPPPLALGKSLLTMSIFDMKFKQNCSQHWKNLVALLPDEDGEVTVESETDGISYVTLLFSGYGEIPNIPVSELEG